MGTTDGSAASSPFFAKGNTGKQGKLRHDAIVKSNPGHLCLINALLSCISQ